MTELAKLKEVDQRRVFDSFVNFAAGMGVTGKDKRKDSVFVKSQRMPFSDMEALYQDDWIAGKIVDIIPDDMTRKWRSFTSDLPAEDLKRFTLAEKELKIRKKINECKRWSRMYGGCVLVLNVDDGKPPSEELILDEVKPDAFKGVVVFDRRYVSPQRVNFSEPMKQNFRMPDTYRIGYTAEEIHHSRVIKMDGVELPYHLYQQNEYWGDPIFRRVKEALINANIATDSSAGLLLESNVDVLGVEGLMHLLATDDGTKNLLNRFQTGKFLKANNNLTLIDKDRESLTKLTNSFSGIGELLDRFLTIVSATADIPATRLFGIAPMGMNATGEGDLRNYYDHISSRQENELRPCLERIDALIARSLGLDPAAIEFEFNSLWQMSDLDLATVLDQTSRAHQIYLDMGVVTESMIAQELKTRKLVVSMDDDRIALLKQLEEEADKAFRAEIGKTGKGGPSISKSPPAPPELEEQS